ncbi:MAG TPA: glycosyltransferase family 2 protein [Vicinamibacterales bacterium]|jgi:GT2 family glycosyltransferase|nr:glycosyltransferase family 2 protein [Vicinamibacterales bacterium]
MASPDVSIVIVNWNGRQFLDACLNAVAAQEGVEAETILVENGSTDGSAAYVAERFPWVRLVALQKNLGFAGGNNAGVREARGPYVAFLNNDTVPDRDWLRRLVAGTGGDETVLATSRIVYMHDRGVIDSAGDGMLRWGGAFKRHHGGRVETSPASGEVFGVCGAACLIARRVFDELGGFDERFFVSHEDVDLSYRARLRGYRCRYVADAVVAHHGSATLGRSSGSAVFHGQRNLEWVYLKNTPLSLLVRTLPGHLVYTGAAAWHFGRAGLLGPFLRAKLAALASLSRVLRQRADVQRSRRVDASAIWPLLEPKWLSTKLKEKRFDLDLAGEPPPR